MLKLYYIKIASRIKKRRTDQHKIDARIWERLLRKVDICACLQVTLSSYEIWKSRFPNLTWSVRALSRNIATQYYEWHIND